MLVDILEIKHSSDLDDRNTDNVVRKFWEMEVTGIKEKFIHQRGNNG